MDRPGKRGDMKTPKEAATDLWRNTFNEREFVRAYTKREDEVRADERAREGSAMYACWVDDLNTKLGLRLPKGSTQADVVNV